jgi:uncharacterized membrane protein HdeD (DUF308 family)
VAIRAPVEFFFFFVSSTIFFFFFSRACLNSKHLAMENILGIWLGVKSKPKQTGWTWLAISPGCGPVAFGLSGWSEKRL